MMQAASDIYLGWTKGVEDEPLALLAPAARHEGLGGRGVDEAVRPHVLRPPMRMDARPRARPIGRPDRDRRLSRQERRFDESITDFSERYADQNEQDYQAFAEAVRSGRLEAIEGV